MAVHEMTSHPSIQQAPFKNSINKHSNLLLLQGPVGPFFRNFCKSLEKSGHTGYRIKVNFNAGDDLFFRHGHVIRFRGNMDTLDNFYKNLLIQYKIDTVYLFGDCRPIHQTAIDICRQMNIPVYVFEEGYIRPQYITLEKNGVNANSTLCWEQMTAPSLPVSSSNKQPHSQIGYGGYYHMVLWAVLYFLAGYCFKFLYPKYQHHKPFCLQELIQGTANWLLKPIYFWQDRKLRQKIKNLPAQSYFLVAVQSHRDSQVTIHNPYGNNEAFLEDVIASFAQHAPRDKYLVIKPHPFDRGYRNYQPLIKNLIARYGLPPERLIFIREIAGPVLLKSAAGCIIINSSMGLSSLFHKTPVIILGHSFYERIPGLVFDQGLENFWQNPGTVNLRFFQKCRSHIIKNTQISGCFYHTDKTTVNNLTTAILTP